MCSTISYNLEQRIPPLPMKWIGDQQNTEHSASGFRLDSAVEKIASNQRAGGKRSGYFFTHPLPVSLSEHSTCQEPFYTDQHSASGSAAHSLCPSRLRGDAGHHDRPLGPQHPVSVPLTPTPLQRVSLLKIVFKMSTLFSQALSFKFVCYCHLYDIISPDTSWSHMGGQCRKRKAPYTEPQSGQTFRNQECEEEPTRETGRRRARRQETLRTLRFRWEPALSILEFQDFHVGEAGV